MVNQIASHLADMVPAAGSVRPPAFQHMDTLLRVAENRMARPTCVYPGALITAILGPIYGQTTYWAGCNSTLSYRCGRPPSSGGGPQPLRSAAQPRCLAAAGVQGPRSWLPGLSGDE